MAAVSHHSPEGPADGSGGGLPIGQDSAPVDSWASALNGTRFGPVEVIGETGSTNADLVARATTADDGLVLLADHQTAGRGRLDRRWVAPTGSNLTFSVLLRPEWVDGPDEPVDRRALVTPALAVAVVGVLRAMGLDAFVKWPNDVVLVGDHTGKVGGILAELVTGERPAVVVGLGLNVAWPPADPADGGPDTPPGATSLARAGLDADRWWVMADVLRAFDRQFDSLAGPDGPELLRADHLAVSATVGSRVRVERPAGDLVGEAVDLALDGALVVVPDGTGPAVEPVEVRAGDVTHLRPA